MKKSTFTLLIVLVSYLSALAGGGWPIGKGKVYIKLAEWWVVADQHYSGNGGIDPNITRSIYNTSFYAELGISDRITAIAYLPIYSRAIQNNEVSGTTGDILTPGEAIGGMGDIDLGFKYSISTGSKIVTSLSLLLGIPTGEASGGLSGTLQTGDGEFNQFFKLDVGTGFTIGSSRGYVTAYGGYNSRSNGFSDEIRYGVEAGIDLFDQKLGITGRLNSIVSTNNGTSTSTSNATSLFANNQEFVSLSPEIRYNINENIGISASYASVISGKLIFANPSFEVGVYSQF